MYYPREKDRVRTILAGTPLSAESIRLSEQSLGSHWHGTSWFFLMHIIAKTFTNTNSIDFRTLLSTVNDYGITRWTNTNILRNELELLTKVFKYRDLGNVHLKNNELVIDGTISDKELRNFADSQYDYSMKAGLVKYERLFRSSTPRSMSNFAERIWWHYMTAIYDSPRIYDGVADENHLEGLFQDIKETMSEQNIKINGVEIWTENQLEHALPLLKGWERELVSKNILRTFSFGENTFIAPRYFPEIDQRSLTSGGQFKGEDHQLFIDLIESINKYPAFPIYKNDKEKYQLARSLERAGAIVIIPEVRNLSVPLYVYLVSRDVFEELDVKLQYEYSKRPIREFGDISVTDEIFRTMGRARLYGQKILPELSLSNRNYENEIDKIFDNLLNRGMAELGDCSPIFDPLQLLNILDISNKRRAVVTSENDFVVKTLSDYWNELINNPMITSIQLPPKEIVERKETGQVRNQVKKRVTNMFG